MSIAYPQFLGSVCVYVLNFDEIFWLPSRAVLEYYSALRAWFQSQHVKDEDLPNPFLPSPSYAAQRVVVMHMSKGWARWKINWSHFYARSLGKIKTDDKNEAETKYNGRKFSPST